ncbi:hypothetical protein EDC45_0969 [Mesocricetibacter intestinalis]|uniref:Pyridoxal phosphate homeostasis protein n=1 Tax=Mesocricetibacter intestinalis TaxID=1521930 RepID=A0A4R6V874_9PAST|nr:YggS family pyridoxal phosphate-dependent enzyme [Mesocricetibacter intestinalis]TDQ57902.1 hypothetical protein EDC45_0969 [Mesocricetibacter intestinalis]
MSVAENLNRINLLIEENCRLADREKSAVKLLAVSKTKPIEAILAAYQQGQTAFGENYVQEGVEKILALQQLGIRPQWHFIGPLQSNKTRAVAEHFDWMQTLDRVKIASRLNEQRPPHKAPLNVLIQINISDESSKSGIPPSQMLSLAQHIVTMPNLCLRGLMAIPAATRDQHMQIAAFDAMAKLFQRLQQAYPTQNIDTLSMGMSDDMATAIRCGSTMVRIGSAIFGQRS